MEKKHELWELRSMQAAPLSVKVMMTKQRLVEFIEEVGDKGTYVSFSGGKDSTVLLDLVRQVDGTIPAVYFDTGLEYPEIKRFSREKGATFVYPTVGRKKGFDKKPEERLLFQDVLRVYGYPLISKEVSSWLEYNTKKLYQKDVFFSGAKYRPLREAPIKVSKRCCYALKESTAKRYESETKRRPIVATTAEESRLRQKAWLDHGCTVFGEKAKSAPMSFWTEQDILEYIKTRNLSIASVYGDIEQKGCMYHCTGCQRTGCIFCLLGMHLEKGETRIQRLKRTHPSLYEYALNGGTFVNGFLQPTKDGLGYKKLFDIVNAIYGDSFYRYK